jgi:hypothetical protein
MTPIFSQMNPVHTLPFYCSCFAKKKEAYEITLLSMRPVTPALIPESRISEAPCMSLLYHFVVARQRLGKHVPGATNAHAEIAELLYVSFSKRSVTWGLVVPRTSCNILASL